MMKATDNKKIILLIPVLFIVISILFFTVSCKPEGGYLGGADGGPETFEVVRGDIIQTVSTSGNVDSGKSNSYSLRSSGTVLKALEEGDSFSKGDVLIELDPSRTVLLLAQAEENMNVSRTSIELAKLSYQQALDANHIAIQLAETGTQQAELASASAYKALENANISASQAYSSAETSLENTENIANLAIAKAKADVDTAEALIVNAATLAAFKAAQAYHGLVKAQQQSAIDTAEGSVDAAGSRAARDTAQGSYDQSVLSQSATYWTNLSSTQSADTQIAITAKNIEQAETQLRLAEINYELLGLDSGSHIIYAPYDGIVLSSVYKTGEYAGPGVPTVEIASSGFVIVAEVNETDIVNMEPGQEALISLDAYYLEELKGKITKISPVSTNIGGVVSYTITVQPEVSGAVKLFHGLSASMEITTSSLEGVLYVPIQAVSEEDGRQLVDVLLEDGNTEKKEVETGIFNYDFIEIKSGLSEGDIIVVSGLE